MATGMTHVGFGGLVTPAWAAVAAMVNDTEISQRLNIDAHLLCVVLAYSK